MTRILERMMNEFFTLYSLLPALRRAESPRRWSSVALIGPDAQKEYHDPYRRCHP
jgi:hypothetical protein